ncbi:gluconokinase [Parvularcula lutaonensis]|uniref:Gluconokinase n=1 Tax=Parvularcula lutaonensis TaxID=491923 RepID=A0ABV7MBC7_9PROT|nr:gluconokinase [Parvularcula lutaonensis]GGY39947.1 hypothetical protein GCM10007148_05480 [Parvularcula lutaonensis]
MSQNATSLQQRRLIVVMGPAGAGKSAVGSAVARLLGVRFIEGDEFHPPENIAKIRAGMGLTNEERRPWIRSIGEAVRALDDPVAVLACSALNWKIRAMMKEEIPADLRFFLLDVPEAELRRRLATRQGHFAGPALLQSQLAAMDRAEEARRVDGTRPVAAIAREIAALAEA